MIRRLLVTALTLEAAAVALMAGYLIGLVLDGR